MIKGLILLADGFEQVEAIGTMDILQRTHQIEVTSASISKHLEVESSHGLEVKADALLENLHPEDFDFIVLPGGKRGVDNLDASKAVHKAIEHFLSAKKLVAAICAAPSILGKMGALDHKKYTCFPGFQAGKGEYLDVASVKDGALITGHSMGYTIPFAEAIVRYYLGMDGQKAIAPGVYGLQ